jgi:hypothetical protein
MVEFIQFIKLPYFSLVFADLTLCTLGLYFNVKKIHIFESTKFCI